LIIVHIFAETLVRSCQCSIPLVKDPPFAGNRDLAILQCLNLLHLNLVGTWVIFL